MTDERAEGLIDDIRRLADRTVALDENDLAAPWSWGSYSSEGLRFAFFRILEELDGLRVQLTAQNRQLDEGGLVLAGYHQAYRDLEAVVWGLEDSPADREPADGEWSARRTYAHILAADLGFFAVCRFALDLHQAGNWDGERKISEADYDRILDMTEAQYEELMESRLSTLRSEHDPLHARILSEFGPLSSDELDLPSRYWEQETYPLRFRLARFASHMRQHTIQIERTRSATGYPLSESSLLLRQIFNQLAAVENTGVFPGSDLIRPVRDTIDSLIEALPNSR